MKDFIGMLLGYGNFPCCGRTFWRRAVSVRVWFISDSGRMKVICEDCANRWGDLISVGALRVEHSYFVR